MAETAEPLAPDAPMPPLDTSGPPISRFEFWPPRVFYTPFALWWTCLGLRYGSPTLLTAANPLIEAGGLVGESKRAVFEQIGPPTSDLIATWTTLTRTDTSEAAIDSDCRRARTAMRAAGLDFPVVVKPDMGCRGAGVRVARGEDQLRDYIAGFPCGATFLMQELVDGAGEAGGGEKPEDDARSDDGADSDRQQPATIEADRVEIDREAGVSRYFGDVVFVQGTLRVTGNTMTLRANGGRVEYAETHGEPATVRQETDAGEQVDAEARTIEYAAGASRITLIGNAVLRRAGERFAAGRIRYRTDTGRIQADARDNDERVRIRIDPSKQPDAEEDPAP